MCSVSDYEQNSGCRLSIGDHEAMLDGTPQQLRALGLACEQPDTTVEITLADTVSKVRRELTASPLLRISVEGRTVLVISGAATAVDLYIDAVRGVADQGDKATPGEIRRHAHVEYLGVQDQWRASNSFPLVISSDRPGPPT
jgi:hypothetical protein